MNIINSIFIGVLGAVVGSFLNVVIDRLPEKKSLITPTSHCDQCKKKLSILELIPIFSYMILRGRCKNCNEKIPSRVFVVELGTSILFLLTWFRFGQSWETFVFLVYGSILIVLSGIDLEHQKIPNILIYPAIGLALIMIPFLHTNDIWMMLAGGLLGFGVLFLIAVLAPGAMGMGDVKLVIFLGLIIGFPDVVLALFLGFVSGGLVAGILLILKKIGRKDSIAFGPFLALGGFVTLLYGSQIIEWWLGRLSG
jgi:leader peptidase (prepilin peptidase)/N-methyltransferase